MRATASSRSRSALAASVASSLCRWTAAAALWRLDSMHHSDEPGPLEAREREGRDHLARGDRWGRSGPAGDRSEAFALDEHLDFRARVRLEIDGFVYPPTLAVFDGDDLAIAFELVPRIPRRESDRRMVFV